MEKKLIDRFISFETKYNLFEEEIAGGVKVWPLIRDEVYFQLEAELKGYDEKGKKDIDASFIEIFGKLPALIKNLSRSLIQPTKSAEILFVAHPRRKKINNCYIDIYTDPVIDRLQRSNIVIEPLYQLQHFTPAKNENIYYLDFIDLWARGTSLLKRNELPDGKRSFWGEVNTLFQRQFSVSNINILKTLELEFTRFQRAYPLLKRLIQKVDPKIIVEVVGYQRLVKCINVIAKELGIPTAELQHGYIGSKHISYNFPDDSEEVQSFPDYLFVWGEYWKKNIQLPIDKSHVLTTGYEFFNQRKKPFLKDNTSKNLLFISQATIGRELAHKALELSHHPKFKDYKIQFKLHPTEFSEQYVKYEDLYTTERVKVIDSDSDQDLYTLIMESKAVFGGYSTALIEAVGLGKKVYVLNVSGWKAFEGFINEKKLDIEFLDNFEFLDISKTPNSQGSNFLFASTNYSHINEIIDKQ